MHKVITINLNGNAYQVEESGYNALLTYLNGAESQLRDNPDRTEIMSDLEQAIAEKCGNYLRPQKTVVTSAEIEQIIREMGPVDGNPGLSSDEAKQEDSTSAKSGPTAQKRLFRIRKGQMVSGVCTGLAAYFGLDVTIVRVICLLVAIPTGGASVIAYFILSFVIPYAETSEEYAAAYGMNFNAQDFINQAKEHYSELKEEGKEWKKRAREKRREWQQAWRRTLRTHRYGYVPVGPASVMYPLAGAFFGIIVGVLSLIWIYAVISLVNTHSVFGWPLPVHFPLWVAILILIVILQIVTGPLKYSWSASNYSNHPWGGLIALSTSTIWLAFMVVAVWLAYQHLPEVREFLENLPQIWNEILNGRGSL